jgi:hypothetical protein
MKRIGGILEGLILLSIGAYAGLLVFFGDYWRFLNPKFKWLTAATALLLILVGAMAACHPDKRPKLSRIIIFLFLLRVFYVANSGISLSGHGATRLGAATLDKEKPRVTMNGIEYVKINLAELHLLCGHAENLRPGLRYAVRGIVKRNKPMDRQGQFALVRNTVFCCLADSVGMGFRVQYDGVDYLSDGQWVEVYAAVKGLSEKLPDPGLRIKGMNLTVLSDSDLLVADKVVKIKEPEIPYIINIRSAEPYAY